MPITDFIGQLGLSRKKNDAIPGYEAQDYYAVPDMDKTICDADGMLETVIIRDAFVYKGINLIGVTESKVLKLLQQEPSEIDEIDLADEEDGAPYRVFTFDELGLQVWSLEDRVVSVTCWQYEDEEADN